MKCRSGCWNLQMQLAGSSEVSIPKTECLTGNAFLNTWYSSLVFCRCLSVLFWNSAAVQWLCWSLGFYLMVELLFSSLQAAEVETAISECRCYKPVTFIGAEFSSGENEKCSSQAPYCIWESQVVANVSKHSHCS